MFMHINDIVISDISQVTKYITFINSFSLIQITYFILWWILLWKLLVHVESSFFKIIDIWLSSCIMKINTTAFKIKSVFLPTNVLLHTIQENILKLLESVAWSHLLTLHCISRLCPNLVASYSLQYMDPWSKVCHLPS